MKLTNTTTERNLCQEKFSPRGVSYNNSLVLKFKLGHDIMPQIRWYIAEGTLPQTLVGLSRAYISPGVVRFSINHAHKLLKCLLELHFQQELLAEA